MWFMVPDGLAPHTNTAAAQALPPTNVLGSQNLDGQITSADTAWSQLQVWRDLNQDGTSQSGELFTLGALNITRIGLNGSSSGPQAGQTINNSRVALSTTYTVAV